MKAWIVICPGDYSRADAQLALSLKEVKDIKRDMAGGNRDGMRYITVEEVEINLSTEKDKQRYEFLKEIMDNKIDSFGDVAYQIGKRGLLDD